MWLTVRIWRDSFFFVTAKTGLTAILDKPAPAARKGGAAQEAMVFNSAVLDVAVGLILTFLAVSLLTSAVTEAIASGLKLRSKTLLTETQKILNDQEFRNLARSLYNHALISPRDTGTASTTKDLKDKPSYIHPDEFATALMDVVKLTGTAAPSVAAMKQAIQANVPEGQIREFLLGAIDRAGGDLDKLHQQIASWFDNAMDRVSGAYKRKTQLICFIVALLAAGLSNLDAVQIGKALWLQPMITKSITLPNGQISWKQAQADVAQLGAPAGWTASTVPVLWDGKAVKFQWGALDWALALCGWLITAFAALFGAPFWFDALQGLVRLKGTGPSPAEKKTGASAAA